MRTRSRAVTVVQYLSLALLVCAMFLPDTGFWRAYALITGFIVQAAIFVSGLTSMPRHSAIAFGVYMIVAGSALALPMVWKDRPAWWDERAVNAMFIAVVWLLFASVRDRLASKPLFDPTAR